jgi:hypothetical protein
MDFIVDDLDFDIEDVQPFVFRQYFVQVAGEMAARDVAFAPAHRSRAHCVQSACRGRRHAIFRLRPDGRLRP